jgi:hypothetical protein
MILNDEQVKARLGHEKNLANRFAKREIQELIVPRSGPRANVPNLTEEESTEIAIRSRLGEGYKVLSEEFDISAQQVGKIKRAESGRVNNAIADEALGKVKDMALDRLMSSLGLLSNDKLSGCSAKELSVIASNMGRVVEKTTPKQVEDERINLIIYAPQLKREDSYRTIEV